MKHRIFIGIVLLEISIIIILFLHAFSVSRHRNQEMENMRSLVKELMLTDLSVWTEARYSRHPSQTDFFSPFQDFPAAVEHFPAGSILAPPQHLSRRGQEPSPVRTIYRSTLQSGSGYVKVPYFLSASRDTEAGSYQRKERKIYSLLSPPTKNEDFRQGGIVIHENDKTF